MVSMGSDPGSELPPVRDPLPKDNSTIKNPSENKCDICGLTARNITELKDHIKHAHYSGDGDNKNYVYSDEQKIDPFVKTQN
jgi:hypothetical protein